MALPFPLSSPREFGVGSVAWEAVDNIARSRNPWTLKLITQQFAGQMWQGSISIVPQTLAEGRRLAAWMTALRRPGTNSGTFLWEGPWRAVPRGSADTTPGTPAVNGASQTGDTLNVDGLPTSTSGYLLAGDMIQIGTGIASRLLMCLEDVDTDGSGQAAINVWPQIRTAPSDGSTVVVEGAQGAFVTVGPSVSWGTAPGYLPGVTIDCAEVI